MRQIERTKYLFLLLPMLITASSAFALTPAPVQDLRFDSVRVLDLSARPLRPGRFGAVPTGQAALSSADAAAILAAPSAAEGDPALPFAGDFLHCTEDDQSCNWRAEKALLNGESSVQRSGTQLSIRPKSGVTLRFSDIVRAATASADGDYTRHTYLGRVGNGKLHRVDVAFGHDSPGSFLLNPDNGKTVFIHNGSDITALSPDGAHIAVVNTLNPPMSLAVATLDGNGPALELHCTASGDAATLRPEFKGWHDANSFDLVLRAPSGNSDIASLALRLSRSAIGWTMARTDPALPGALVGVSCRGYRPES